MVLTKKATVWLLRVRSANRTLRRNCNVSRVLDRHAPRRSSTENPNAFEFSAMLSYSFGLRYPRVEWRLFRL
jgi:hypothetical protein